MSQDVIIGSTSRSWSRGVDESIESKNPPLTDKEKLRIEQLAQLEMRATRGDVTAQRKMVEINAALADIQKRAKKGDAKAKRLLFTLQGTGLLTLSESKSGPRLIMAGAYGRTKRSAQQSSPAQQANPAQQVQEFLLSLKMRAMAGDPQAIAILQQYQQIIAPPGAGQPEQPQAAPAMQLDLPPPGMAPEGYPPAPMAGKASVGFNRHLAYINGLDDDASVWLYKLNPRYWLKSKDERMFEDIERDRWVENARLNKAMAKRKLALEQGLKAQQAAEAVRSARAEVSETDAQINALTAALQGVGEEEIALAREGGACERAALRRRY